MHQYLFFIGDFPIRAYGLVLSLSIILATGVAYFLAKQDGRWHQHILDMGIYCGLAGILGSRLWDVFFFDWDYYRHHLTELLNVWQGGMAIQGGIVLGTLVGIWYTKRHHIDTWALADIVCPASTLSRPPSSSVRHSGAARTSSTATPSAPPPAVILGSSIPPRP